MIRQRKWSGDLCWLPARRRSGLAASPFASAFSTGSVASRCASVREKIFVRLGCGNIKLLSVLLHHPLRVEYGRDAANGFAHQLQPGEGKFAVRLRVIEGNDLILEQLIQTAGIHFILKFGDAIINL